MKHSYMDRPKHWIKQHLEDCSAAILFAVSMILIGFLSAWTMQYLLGLH